MNVDTSLNVAGGASGTNIIATAYSNNRAGLPGAMGAGGTTQYAVDSDTDTLYRVNPSNGGVLTNALPLGVDISSGGGLDIVTGSNRALGLFTTAGTKAIFESTFRLEPLRSSDLFPTTLWTWPFRCRS